MPRASRSARKNRRPALFSVQHGGTAWTEKLTLEGGREFVVRPICPEDAPVLAEAFHVLTPEEVRNRFLHPINALSADLLVQLTQLDPARAFALVIAEPGPPGAALICAVARLVLDDDHRHAEFAIVVGKPITQYGLGRHLLKKLIRWCRLRKLDSIYGNVLSENSRMMDVVAALGFSRTWIADEPGLTRVELPLRPAQRPAQPS